MNIQLLQVLEHCITTHRVLILMITLALCALFLGIVFLQSGYDKARYFQGNLSYFNTQFANTPLKSMTGFLLVVVTILELISGIACVLGVVLLFTGYGCDCAGFGSMLSAFTLVCLLTGQRIAKDYAGAASLTGYFIISVLGMFAYAFSSLA